jgi:hypothetical protein
LRNALRLASGAAGLVALNVQHEPVVPRPLHCFSDLPYRGVPAPRAHPCEPQLCTNSPSQEQTMTQTAAFRLINAATTTGDGPIFNLEFPHLAAAVQAEITGAPTQAAINVMALLDGGTWDTLAVLDTNQGYLSGEISPLSFPAPIRQIKANIGTLSGGTNPTVSLYFTARG